MHEYWTKAVRHRNITPSFLQQAAASSRARRERRRCLCFPSLNIIMNERLKQAESLDQLPVCIIGAGSSGVTAAKSLKEKGVPFDCFEIGSKIGGMWRYENDNGLSS